MSKRRFATGGTGYGACSCRNGFTYRETGRNERPPWVRKLSPEDLIRIRAEKSAKLKSHARNRKISLAPVKCLDAAD